MGEGSEVEGLEEEDLVAALQSRSEAKKVVIVRKRQGP